jgi:hypothetical protein
VLSGVLCVFLGGVRKITTETLRTQRVHGEELRI